MRSILYFSLLLLILIIFYSCGSVGVSFISITNKAGDGFTATNKRGVINVRPFNREAQQQRDSLALYADQFTLHSINAEQLRQIFQKDKFTWVAVWASWSEESLEQLPTYQRKAERLGLQLVLICPGIDYNTIARKLKEAGFFGVAYVLDTKTYRGIEINRIIDFRKDVYPDCPLTSFQMPHHYLFDGDKLVYFTEGVIKTDSIQARMK